ncbi:hypothetical protein BU23DRAFT_483609 [Bimuria novae-zelandiae CBS 107.79]|uniref:Uncharacterized protein n=1 Tax=Bimuria novae-zelandiae CBS 107.79 TaxID=1447943 RepID=A0A6A5UUK7_9PLEO|nr:hypothetical protein BU23DRAFT_483609 [Bimuria novae-zelandiae CBS 107.79]
MVLHGLLPKPLPSSDVVVGQLVTHPLYPERDGFYSQQAHETIDELNDYHIQLRYKDVFSVDNEGRFMSSYGSKYELGRIYRQPNLLTVAAEQMIQRTSQQPLEAFHAVCNDSDAQQWIYNLAKQQKDFYLVVGTTELHKAVFKRAKLRDAGVSRNLNEAPIEKDARVPRALSRRNSTLGRLGSEPSISGVFGMDVRRCVARISTPAEPHKLEDISYHWFYYDVPGSANKEQLIVGLGDALKANELRLMLDLSEETVQGNLDAISQLSLDALSAAASPLLKPSSPALRGRSPSPHPQLKGLA